MSDRNTQEIAGPRVLRLLIVQLIGGLGMLGMVVVFLVMSTRTPPTTSVWIMIGAGILLIIGLSLSSYNRLQRVNQRLLLSNGTLKITQAGQISSFALRDIGAIHLKAIQVGRFTRHFFALQSRQGQQLATVNAFMFDPPQLRTLLTQIRQAAPNIAFDDGVQAYLEAPK
jgi:hypothetical protein